MKPLAAQALPRDFPSAMLVVPEQVIFKAADGTEVHGQLFKPANASGKLPALVFMHGGPVRQMLPVWHYLYYYHNSYAMNQYLASRGYMVLSVNYRSGIGYGRAFRLAQHRGARGAGRFGISGHCGRGKVFTRPGRRRQKAHRTLGRVVWWILNRAWFGAEFRHLRGGC